jgi:hypothetical protein
LPCSGGSDWAHADRRTAKCRIDDSASPCDVVTNVRGGYVQAVGGNVRDSVSMSFCPVASRGRLATLAGKTWFAVVEKRV